MHPCTSVCVREQRFLSLRDPRMETFVTTHTQTRLQLQAAKQKQEARRELLQHAGQTLGRVSEQMGSLLDRQSSQRILPDEPRLLTRAEFRVTSGSNKVRTFRVGGGRGEEHSRTTSKYLSSTD